jgi:hypothetical protein
MDRGQPVENVLENVALDWPEASSMIDGAAVTMG